MSVKSDSPEPQSARSVYQTGLGFEADGSLELAEKSYGEALKLLEPADQELFKALHYRLGRVTEARGKLEVAEEHYNAVAACG